VWPLNHMCDPSIICVTLISHVWLLFHTCYDVYCFFLSHMYESRHCMSQVTHIWILNATHINKWCHYFMCVTTCTLSFSRLYSHPDKHSYICRAEAEFARSAFHLCDTTYLYGWQSRSKCLWLDPHSDRTHLYAWQKWVLTPRIHTWHGGGLHTPYMTKARFVRPIYDKVEFVRPSFHKCGTTHTLLAKACT